MLDRRSMNFPDFFPAHAANNPGKPAIVADAETIDWRTFEQRANRIGNALLAAGLAPGDKVAALIGNSVEGILLFLGTLKAGCVYVPISTFLSAEQIGPIVRDADARLFFVSHDYRATAEAVRAGLDGIADGAWISVDFEAQGWTPLAGFCADAASSLPSVRPDPADVACLWYSSGTTGTPKGVMRSFHSLESLGVVTAIEMGCNAQSVTFIGTPLSSSGTWVTLLATLVSGGTIVLPAKFTTAGFLAAVERHRVTHGTLVPTMLSMLLEDPALDATDFGSIRGILSLGSNLHSSTRADIVRRITPYLYDMYGLTEGFGTISGPGDEVLKPGTVGRPTLGSELRIVDEEGREAAPDVAGEIVGIGPMMMTGYYKRPEDTEKTIWRDENGRTFIRSGDIGRKDGDGYVFIMDRKKDMIISGGLNIYPADLEGVLKGRDDLDEIAVIGVPHQKWGETPVALVKPRPGSAATADEIRDWANARLARHQKMDAVIFWDDFPRNAFGKLLKYQIRDSYLCAKQE